MLKNLEGLPADHPMRDFMTPLYHLSDQHLDQDSNMLLYPGHHHDNGLNLPDNFHAMNPVNYMQNMGKNPMHSMFNLQDMVSGAQLHDKNPALNLPLNSEIPQATVDKKEDGDDEDGEDESGDDSPNKKRGKYKTYTDEEKAQILTLATKHGIEKTLDLFSEGEHKLTKRKLRSWLESQDKVKGVKGRKSNEPNRDAHLYEWYVSFQNEHSRPPTRKEATKRALEITDDPKFQASKGWLDKFSRKFQVEFTPLKIVPPKMLKKGPLEEDLSTATTMGSAALAALVTADTDLSPKTAGKKLKLDKLQARKIQSAPIQEKDETYKLDATKFGAGSAFKNTLSQTPHDSQHQGFHPPTHFKAPAQSFNTPMSNPLGDASLAPKNPTADPTLDQNKSQNGYPAMPFYPMDYSMYNPFPYHQGVYPNMPNYPSLNYPMNMPMSYPPGFAENFQRLQQAMKKDNDPTKGDKPN